MSSSLQTSAPTSSPVVPLEIQFLILDQINPWEGEAKAHLYRLAFVCLAWATHIQSILFRRVYVLDPGRFVSLLNESKHLGQYVTSLSLAQGVASLSEMLALLPNVHSIDITDIFTPLQNLGRWCPTVTRMSIRFCVLPTAQGLWDFIGSFPSCDQLEFSGWMLYHGDPVASLGPTVTAPTVHLKHLALTSSQNHTPQPVARWLVAHNVTVDSLIIGLSSKDDRDASEYNMLLSKVGHSLRDLEVIELPEKTDPAGVVGIRISPCTALRCLTLNLRFSTTSAINMRTGLLPLLQQISSPLLTMLRLRMSLTKQLLDLPWEEMDRNLTGNGFVNLQWVVLDVCELESPDELRLSFEEFEGRLEGVMVVARQRGLLHLKRSDYY
ncbi:hypothetical protein C8R44DRAFT_865726 [Mycena epipterygia]|nr:hypothetical protein C8R44DRAFT_865726 [Mycena epipterygia]